MPKFRIIRTGDYVDTAYDAADLVAGLKHAKRLARENHRSYTVAYIGSRAPIVKVNERGRLSWH